MQNLRESDALLEASRMALVRLQDAIGIPLHLYLFSGAWREISDDNSRADIRVRCHSIPGSALPIPSLTQPEPFLVPLEKGLHVLGIPVGVGPESVVYAVGETLFGTNSLLRAIAVQSQQIQELQASSDLNGERIDNFADQMLKSFEEHNWLVQLTEHLEVCEVSRDLTNVVQNLLPRLRSILSAEVVAFLPESETSRFGTPIIQRQDCLNRMLDDFDFTEVVQRFRQRAIVQPFVTNWQQQTSRLQRIPGVSSLMIACVSRGSQLTGWLIAINIKSEAVLPSSKSNDPDDPGFSDMGFGTSEAALLRSAASVLATHQHNLKLFHANQSMTVGVVRSLADAVDARDPYTHGHSHRVARLGHHLARRIGASAQICEQVLMTGLLHDIGKIGVPDSVLLKADRLSDPEFDLIKQHPVIGCKILQHIKELEYTLEGVLHHHESWDGSGYPDGLAGNAIPLFGRLLAVVDSFDAMTSSRPYRHGMSFEKAERILKDGAGKQWDPILIETFLQFNSEFRGICQDRASDGHSIDLVDLNALCASTNSLKLEAMLQ